ncbi:DUF2059 domain-containing protein [Rubritalea marina]|uniref:DUF2059 domain-containing protein n=1 Tax=Rubritalea marina TaxID=361055 RepID=UPI0003693E6C|nr:DUF2059 domain-containing protein [Rubritalea marina]
MMKKPLILALALMSQGALADEASTAKARELMEVMEMRQNVEKAFGQVIKYNTGMIDQQPGMTPEQKSTAKEAVTAATKVSIEEMLKVDWEGMFAEIYGEVFSVEEVQGLIDFYQSPVGKKFTAKQAELTQATMGRMQMEMAKMMPKIQAATQKAVMDATAPASKASE